MTSSLDGPAVTPGPPLAGGIALRPLDLGDYESEMRRVYRLSLECFRENLLFTPIGWEEFAERYRPLRPHLQEGLSWVAESGGAPAGFVFGVPDPKWKEGIKAVCQLRVGHSLEAQALIDFVGERIARYKKPQQVEFVGSLPLKGDGSPDRAKIKELYGE